MRDLHYVPNVSASTLASARTDMVGVLLPSLTHTVFTDVLRGIYDGIDGTRLYVQLGNTRYDPREEERLIGMMVRQKPAAMIISGTDQSAESRRMLKRAGCPVVQIMDLAVDPIDCIIGFSHEAAGRQMTEHLIDQGYRRIVFLGGVLAGRSSGRVRGYHRAMAAAGLDAWTKVYAINPDDCDAMPNAAKRRPDGTWPEYVTPEIGRHFFRAALTAGPPIDAVFCNNDVLALGVLFECLHRGLRVPDDVGIAGFNDLDFMAAAEPALSTVRTFRYKTGLDAVMAIRERLAGGCVGQRIVDVGFEIMRRRSTERH